MQMVYGGWTVVLFVVVVLGAIKERGVQADPGLAARQKRDFWHGFEIYVQWLKLDKRIGKYYGILVRDHRILFGQAQAIEQTRYFLSKVIGMVVMIVLLLSLCGFSASSDASLLGMMVLFAVILPLVMYKQVQQQLKRRRMLILMELPNLLNKVTLLMNAGETLQGAMMKAVQGKQTDAHHPLYKEWFRLVQQMKNHEPFQQALEEFNRRCAVQEVSLLTNTILLNFRRGGTEFVAALAGLSFQLWEARKAAAKTLGEEASSKLVFPMVLVFLIVLTITAAPAILSVSF
ncbi:type II secretion system protein [Marinicrinis sediminis]|uniref:Type II secretion system protein n=1 Tax=Marinicrinis sediminis TaxID=1652465 RepID=A0ABW5RDB7_9BACL